MSKVDEIREVIREHRRILSRCCSAPMIALVEVSTLTVGSRCTQCRQVYLSFLVKKGL